MESKKNYLIIFLSFASIFATGQNAADSTTINSNQTVKGVTAYEGLPFEEIPVPIEEVPISISSKVIAKSDPLQQMEIQTKVEALPIDNQKVRESTPIGELQKILEDDLIEINKKLSSLGLEYREERILRIKKEEAEYDLSFLRRIEGIKETIAYETTGNSEAFVVSADQFLDTLYNEDTEVSERFKDLSQERYDNYLAKDKIVKLRLNDVKIEQVHSIRSTDKVYKYSGYAMLPRFGKKVRVEFFSDTFVRKADRKLMYQIAKEDNIEQEITVEGVIYEYKHGRIPTSKKEDLEMPLSNISIQDWIIIDREILIQDLRNE